MIRKNIKIISAVMFTVITFFSCTAPIDINTRDSKPVIVIYGLITDELKYQDIRITSSSPYFDKKVNMVVTDAKVVVSSSNGEEYLFLCKEDGYYVSEEMFAATPGITYKLTVDVDFDKDGVVESYEAEATIPPVIYMDSININPISIMGYRHYALDLYIQEPAETDNYYLFRFFINDIYSNDVISEYIISEDRMYNGEYLNGVTIYNFEDITDESLYLDEENDYYVETGDIIRLQVLNIEKGYYHFINQCISEKYGENPFFGGPPSNITTNLSNGAVGYFSGLCIQEKETVVP